MKAFCAHATAAAVVLAVFAGFAAASMPCWKAAIDDWYVDGRFDSAWSCECLRNAAAQLPVDGHSSAREAFQAQLELRKCVGAAQIATVSATPAQPGGTDKSIVVTEDSFPWEVAIVGGLALGLTALIGLAVLRLRQRGG